jgi:O-antigen/teichoic acid export membrane protein
MDLREKVIGGLIWAGSMRFVSQILTWIITIIVIRLLSPADYGLLAMAMVFVGLVGLFAEAGLGLALVQSEQVDDVNLRKVFAAVIVVNCFLYILCFAASALVADFFGEERLVSLVRVLAVQFLIGIFTVIPNALLVRVLDFKRQSVIGLASSIFASLITLILAMHGFGVWSLVAGALASNVFSPLLSTDRTLPCSPKFCVQWRSALADVRGQVTAARLLWYLYSQVDVLIAGKLLGKEALGFYSVSMNLASLPVQKISAVLNQVAFPAFARSQSRPDLVSEYVLKATRLLSFVSVPTLWGISSIAPEIVQFCLGPTWTPATLPLQLLALIMPLTTLNMFLATAYQGIGRGDTVFINVLIATLTMPVAFLIGSQWGLLGLSLAWVLVYPIVFIINQWRALPQVGLTLAQVAYACGRSAFAGLGMYAGVLLARHLAKPYLSGPILALALATIGASVYVLITLCANRRAVRELIGLIHGKAIIGLESGK